MHKARDLIPTSEIVASRWRCSVKNKELLACGKVFEIIITIL